MLRKKKKSADFGKWKEHQANPPRSMTREEFEAAMWRVVEKMSPEKLRELREQLPTLVKRVQIQFRRNKFRPIRGGKRDPEPSLKSEFTL
jgi:hypothetical protein